MIHTIAGVQFCDSKYVAAQLGYTVRSLYGAIALRRVQLAPALIVGNARLYRVEDVQREIERRAN